MKKLIKKIRSALRTLDLKITGMPGNILFHTHVGNKFSHGAIWVQGLDGSIRIPFICENSSGLMQSKTYVLEEIVRQARVQGFEPIYLACRTPKATVELNVDPNFAL